MTTLSQNELPLDVSKLKMEEVGSSSLWRDAWHRLLRNRLTVFSMIIIAITIFIAVFGPVIAPYDYLAQDFRARREDPTSEHILGTDELGRDVLSRVIYGTRTAMLVAVAVTGVSLIIGVTLGTLAGYLGGWVDGLISWFTDLVMSVPHLLLAVVISVSLKTPITRWMDSMYLETKNSLFRQTNLVDLVLVFGAMSLVMWPTYARLIRGQILSIRNQNYITAARALGIPTRRILIRYVVPNALGPIIVAVSAGMGSAMVLESAFSFLGVGVRPPSPSWGNMITEGLRVWRTSPHLLLAPASALAIVTIAFSMLGDGLNDALNPRQWK